MRYYQAIGAVILCALALGACSSGSSSHHRSTNNNDNGSLSPTVAAPSYEKLDSKADVTSTLGGVSLQSDGETGELSLVSTNGTLKHDTGLTTMTGDKYAVTDNDGFDAKGVLTDGSTTLISDGNQGFSGDYDYVSAHEANYKSGETTYDAAGFHGVVTSADDMPTSMTATYVGEANGIVITGDQGFDLTKGKSTVNVDFTSGSVEATMNGFTATSHVNGAVAAAPIDTIKTTGMQISGNSFSGGTIETLKDGAAVDVTGANSSSSAQGNFYGYDATSSKPDEVAGIALKTGDSGIVAGTFIAD